MKGGRTAPRDLRGFWWHSLRLWNFNEGGADCPPRHFKLSQCRYVVFHFNEGGADCPPRHDLPSDEVQDYLILQ